MTVRSTVGGSGVGPRVLFALCSGQGGCDRRGLVLRTNEASLNYQLAIATDADERAGAGDLRGIVPHRTVFECRKCGFDLAQPLINVV